MATRELLVVQPFTLRIRFSNDDNYLVLAWNELGIGEPVPDWYLFEDGDLLLVDGDIRHRRLNGSVQEICGPREDILDELKSRGYLRE